MVHRIFVGLTLVIVLSILGCATRVGVRPSDEKTIYRQLTINAISDGRPSSFSDQLLARLGLGARFTKDPQRTLADIHTGLGGPEEQDRLFVLAELSYLYARQTQDPRYYLAAAVYAYLFLFPDEQGKDPLP